MRRAWVTASRTTEEIEMSRRWNVVSTGLFALMIALTAFGVGRETKAMTFRRHFAIKGNEDVVLFTGTIVTSLSDKHDQRWLLLEDADGRRFILINDADYVTHLMTHDVRDLETKEFLRASFKLDGDYHTRSELFDSSTNDPHFNDDGDINVTVVTNATTVTALQRQWLDHTFADQWRRQIRVAMSPPF